MTPYQSTTLTDAQVRLRTALDTSVTYPELASRLADEAAILLRDLAHDRALEWQYKVKSR